MKSNAHILIVGKDEMLLRTRQMILGTHFQVETAGRVSHAAGLLAGRRFDLLVLCYSLTDEECRQVVQIARNHPPQPEILEIIMLGRPCAAVGIQEELNSEDGPYALLQKAADMVGFELKSIRRSARAS